MKYLLLTGAFLLTLIHVSAAVRITPFGILDSEESVRVNYNVKTEKGLETRSDILDLKEVGDSKSLEKLMRKRGCVKYILAPGDAEVVVSERTFYTYLKPESKSTPVQFQTRVFNRVKSLIIAETRKYYKSEIPKAVAPNGGFFNETGGAMVLVDKGKHPIGTLIISYKTEFVCPSETERENSDFMMVSKIPDTWVETCGTDDDGKRYRNVHVLPSGEKVICTLVGRFWRCVGFKIKTTVKYTFNKLKK